MRNFDIGDYLFAFGVAIMIIGLSVVYITVLNPEDDLSILKSEPIPIVEAQEPEIVEVVEEEKHISDEEMMAMVVMAESGNQDMLGKVAVATTILNRCDYFGKTVESVITEPNQYTYPYYGTVSEESYRAVEIAMENRDLFPSNMLFFRNTRYHDFGTPYEQIGDHYFSLKED